jgi:hypothetical protein
MKKSKIFLTTATLVLAVTALFATKANKKFAQVTSAKTTASHLVNFSFKSDITLMTTANTGNELKLNVANQTGLDLVTVSSTDHQIYLR